MQEEAKKVWIWLKVGEARLSHDKRFVVLRIDEKLCSLSVEDIIDLTAGYIPVCDVKALSR